MERAHLSPDVPAPAFVLRTLGGAGLNTAGGDDALLGPGKPFALLTYLALAPGRRASRETLIDLLWADIDAERARRALRQTLFHLRRLIGDDTLAGTEELVLSATLETDRDAFLTALERDELEQAVVLYRGEFLTSFGVPGGAAFEQWADLERGRLQTSFVRAGELLVRRLLNRGDAREGRRVARLVRDRAVHEEAAWRLVIEAAVSTRDFVTAGVEAAALEEWAASEQVVLEPATRAALTRARRVGPPAEGESGASGLVAELTGREREFHIITAAWDAVRTGASRHIHLSAPAGLGKTRLLHDALARLDVNGARVVSLRGTPGDRDVPYAFAADLAAALAALPGAAGVAPDSAATLLALNPALSALLQGPSDTAPGDEMLRRRIHALADLAQSVAHERRFTLAIDDVHWIDLSSLRVLDGLLSRLGDARVLCLTAARSERVLRSERTTVLTLGALSETQVGALVSALGTLPESASWTGEFVSGVHAASRGSPLLVLETLRLALDESVLTLENAEWRCGDVVRLRDLLQAGEALRARVRTLPDASQSVLALLATAGVPLDDEALATMQRVTAAELAPRMALLEQLGLAVRASSGWMPAHDEIADAARSGLSDIQRAAAERELGDWFSREAGGSALSLLRAAHHARAAGNAALVEQLFLRYAQRARGRGDPRSFMAIASEFAADEDALAVRLAARVPWTWRAGLWSSGRRRWAGLVTGVVAVAVLAAAWSQRARDASLQRLIYADSAHRISATSVRPEEWDGRSAAVHMGQRASMLADVGRAFTEFAPAPSPDGRAAVWTQDAGDSTTLDLWIRTPKGTRRLTAEARDDIGHQWLPDGSGVVGTSNRWSPPGDGDYDIAVFDTATGAARQITHGTDHDTSPRVSPDGTRVAFVRESETSNGELCVTSIDGRHEPQCRAPGGRRLYELAGWVGTDELAIIVEDGPRHPLVILDWSRDQLREVLGPLASHAQLSPDRRWLVAALRREGVRGTRDWIVPVDAPTKARAVEAGAAAVRWWEGRSDATLMIDRLEFTDTMTTLPFGITTRLRVHSLTTAGTEVPLYVPLTWTTSDSLVAVVDPVGEVRPRGTGAVTIAASIPGWRRAQRTYRIEGEPPTVLVREAWDASWPSRWLAWGDPAPTVKTGPGGVRGFANNGDGVFVSMGVSRRAFSARQGLGVEMRVSTPLTRTKWQRLRAYLVADIDTTALVGADQHGGSPSLGRLDTTCGVGFPEPGSWGANRMTFLGGISNSTDFGTAASALRSGAWWTLRLQILPDGRCGIAINGRAVWLSTETVPLDRDYRVRLGDDSNGTTILHGPLEIWTGVRTDLDWSRKP